VTGKVFQQGKFFFWKNPFGKPFGGFWNFYKAVTGRLLIPLFCRKNPGVFPYQQAPEKRFSKESGINS